MDYNSKSRPLSTIRTIISLSSTSLDKNKSPRLCQGFALHDPGQKVVVDRRVIVNHFRCNYTSEDRFTYLYLNSRPLIICVDMI